MPFDGANIRQVRQALMEYGLSPNKKLGQNFLCDANIADAIVDAAGELNGKDVLEIGPGAGALTIRLLKWADHVTAIELDAGLCRLLRDKVTDERFTLIHADALKVPLEDLCLHKPTTLVANLPYYVTTPLLMRYMIQCEAVDLLVLMMQKEVAQRLCAQPGTAEYGALSVAVQYYAEVKYALQVSKNCFYPAPQVSSSVVILKRRERAQKPKDEEMLFRVVHACFSMRRKTLQNNLAAVPELGKHGAQKALALCGIDGVVRGETLSLSDFIMLSDAVSEVVKD